MTILNEAYIEGREGNLWGVGDVHTPQILLSSSDSRFSAGSNGFFGGVHGLFLHPDRST
jgi:hypothetical protein